MKSCAAVHGSADQTTLACGGLLAYWRDRSGDRQGAVDACEQLLPQALAVLGDSDPAVLSMRHNLATFRDWTYTPEAAVAAYDAILQDYTRIIGPDHPVTANAAAATDFWRGQAARMTRLCADICRDLDRVEFGADEVNDEKN